MSLRRSVAAALLVGLAVGVQTARPTSAQTNNMPALDHIFVIVMENHGYNEIIGSSAAPYINGLLSAGGLATNYYAVAHPSLPNYLALTGGTTYGITSDCTTCWVSATNIADRLEAAGKTWKTYQESMPSACFIGDSYPYVQKHDPLIYFNDIRTNGSRCANHVVPFSQLTADLASTTTTPNFALITPNACNDMHDCSVGTGDAWLSQQVPQILASPAFTTQHSLLAVTWDEDDYAGSNQVATIFLGGDIAARAQSSMGYNHYSLLRTIEDGLGLATLTSNDAGAAPMVDLLGSALVGWSRLGGVSLSGVGASSWGVDRTDIFVRGQDDGLWQSTSNGSAWTGWVPLGGVITSAPAAVDWGSGRIDVVARGQDGALYHRFSDGTRWWGWEALGGGLDYGPTLASWSPQRLDIFITGLDGALWHKFWDGKQWGSWESLGGILTSQPTAVSTAQGRIDIFGRGADGQMWHMAWLGNQWSGWQPLGGLFTSGPVAASCSSGHLDVYAVGLGNGLWHDGSNGSGWSGWQPMGGMFTTDPGAVCPPGSATVQIFERAPDRSAVQNSAPGS